MPIAKRRPLTVEFPAVLVLPLVLVLALAVSCGGDSVDPNNLVTNPGFEDGLNGWGEVTAGLSASGDQSFSGGSSALLQVRATPSSPTDSASGVFQESTVEELPEILSFDYLVNHWVKGTEHQYVEAIVVVTGGGLGMPTCPGGGLCPNIQIRYLLAGAATVPPAVANSGYIFAGEEDPAIGQWVHFERNIRQDFPEVWGSVPSIVEKVRVQIEIRYDNRKADEAPLEADLYVDNVYLGPR